MLRFFPKRPDAGVSWRLETSTESPPSRSDVLARPLALATGSDREELRALAQESDSALFFEGLMGFAGRQEQAGRPEFAAEIYSVLLADSGHPNPQQTLARERLNAILGRGAFGARAEHLLRHFAQQASDPAALFAMGGAGLVFRMTRLATLSRLALSPEGGFLTRGFGARAVASLAGFAAEAPAFTLAGRVANEALGREQNWGGAAFGREVASGYLVLGALRLAGWGSGATYRNLSGNLPAARCQTLENLFQNGGMLGGIMIGHSLEERFGLREGHSGATLLTDSLVTLLQFHVAGRLTRQAFGTRVAAFEQGLDLQAERIGRIGPPIDFSGMGLGEFAVAGVPSGSRGSRLSQNFSGPQVLMMQGHGESVSAASSLRMPKMGIRGEFESPRAERLNREEAERQLKALVPRGYVEAADMERPGFVSQLLKGFGVSDHAFDQGAFRQGFQVAQSHPDRVASLAFDIDEVLLHWSMGPADLFRGTFQRGAEAYYRNTEASLLEYAPFESSPTARLNFFERLWFEGIQRLFPGRLRQHIQFHPGVRAFQLGLRLGQNKNLIMATTGPAGRILRLVNEDPAMKMIYFGKAPSEPVTIDEIRQGLNIYTREDLVLAMREVSEGQLRFPENPLVEDYLARIRQYPSRGVKLKHPAIAVLRGKRAFDALVDDSSSTFEMLGNMEGFSVLQPPSARPSLTLNFTLGSTQRYLDRMANGYVHELGQILAAPGALQSQRLSSGATSPEDYPLQRFEIEIPWNKFGAEFVAPNRELRVLGRDLAARILPPATKPATPVPILSLGENQLSTLTDRLHREFEVILDERPGNVSVEGNYTLMVRDLAATSPTDFQAMLDRYFTEQEQAALPQSRRPLAERGTKYFSRIASLMATKKAVCQLLALDPAEHSREVLVRLGRPVLSGLAGKRLGSANMLTTLADDGEVGIGIALMEPEIWSSGLVGIGVDLTNSRVSYTAPAQHALAEAAYKATYPAHNVRRFNHYRAREIVQSIRGSYSLSGKTMQAAREMRGDGGYNGTLPVHALNFQIGDATAALVALPSFEGRRPRRIAMRPFGSGEITGQAPREPSPVPYLRDADGFFQLPNPGMTVAILGDVGGTRSIELARQGHHSIHFERDADMLEMAERLFGAFREELLESAPMGDVPLAEFRQGDWFQTSARADRVEAYYPLHIGDVPRAESPEFHPALRNFLDRAMLSKIAPGGSGFVVSEFSELIQGLEQVVREDPQLELVEAQYGVYRLPLVGGFGVTHKHGNASYLVFRQKP